MEIREYQRRAKKTKFAKDADAYFHGLIGEVGSIFSAHKKSIRSSENMAQNRAELDEQIGDAIWYLSAIASEYKVSLAKALKNNLNKTANHFIASAPKYYDSDYPKSQQIPRIMSVRFKKTKGGKVTLSMNREPLGDALDDNSMKPDGYRFHDVFHLAFATHLAWSPVLRRLLHRKRKAVPSVDNSEDGARAAAMEEAVSAFVFAEQAKYGGFDVAENIPYQTLEIIKRVTASLEVGNRTIPDWRRAISSGFKMFKKLKDNKGGCVTANLKTKKMAFRP